MAIIDVSLLAPQTGQSDRGTSREYTATFQVQTDSIHDGPVTAANAPQLPLLDSAYDLRAWGMTGEYDGNSVCTTKTPTRQTQNRLWWLVVVKYKSPDAASKPDNKPDGNDQQTNNPLLWRPDVQEGWLSRMEAMEEAIAVNDIGEKLVVRKAGEKGAVLNTAGEAFNPPPEIDNAIKTIKITKNFDRYPSEAANFQQPVVNNKFIVLNYPANYTINIAKQHGLMMPWTGKLAYSPSKTTGGVYIAGFSYWQMTQEIRIDILRGFHKRFLNQGLNRRAVPGDPDGHGGSIAGNDIQPGMPQVARIVDAKGHPVAKPVPLDANGQPLKPGDDKIYLEYQWFDESDWSGCDWSD